MISRFLFMGLPALIGFGVGFIFAWQLALILLGVVWVIAAWLWESTRNAELGSLIGVFAMIIAVSAAVGLAISFAIVYGWMTDLSWLFRPGVL
jgi:hypothetical protein